MSNIIKISVKDDCGSVLETVLVIIPLMLSLLAFFTIGMIAAFMAEASTILMADFAMIKAVDKGYDSDYLPYIVNFSDLAVGHPPEHKNAAIVNLQKNVESAEDIAFLNFFAGYVYNNRKIPIGFSDDPSYIQATAGVVHVDADQRIVWGAYRIPNFLSSLTGTKKYFTLSSGSLRRLARDLDYAEMAVIEAAPSADIDTDAVKVENTEDGDISYNYDETEPVPVLEPGADG